VGTENFVNVLEKFHIYNETYTNSQLNDKANATVIHQNCPRDSSYRSTGAPYSLMFSSGQNT